MSTEPKVPDAKTVREIARKHIRSGHTDIGLTLIDHFGNGVLGDEEYDAWERAVRPVWRTELRTVSWPDERQDVPLSAAELAELTASVEHLSGPDAWDEERLEPALMPVMSYMRRVLAAGVQAQDEPDVCVCGDPNCMPYWRPVHEKIAAMRISADRVNADFTHGLLEEICELRTGLEQAQAQAKAAQDERDGDVRAVAALLRSIATLDRSSEYNAVVALEGRFADRIAALEARDAKAGAGE